jgi:hypothetical protein
MKRWMIIALSVVVLMLLAFNAIRKRVNHAKDLHQWYVERLGYKFSGKVDSVFQINSAKGFIIFHTNDSIDDTIEDYLSAKKELKGYKMRFLMFRPAGKITIFTTAGGKAAIGDSLYIDSDADRISIFRDGNKLMESSISASLRRSF